MSHHRHLGKIPGYRKLAPQAGFEPATLRLTGELLGRAHQGGPTFMGLSSVGARHSEARPLESKSQPKACPKVTRFQILCRISAPNEN
jgi:hypothetical protein